MAWQASLRAECGFRAHGGILTLSVLIHQKRVKNCVSGGSKKQSDSVREKEWMREKNYDRPESERKTIPGERRDASKLLRGKNTSYRMLLFVIFTLEII